MYQINYNAWRSLKGFNRRVRFLVMHYTATDFAKSVQLLSGSGGVSAHYLMPDPTEQTYIDAGFNTMQIFNLVDENDRAWHAGVSQWADRTNLNDTSIGIEIVNLASEEGGVFVFPPFNSTQIDALKELASNIIQRYPDMSPTNIVGHSDIAPSRKSDPGAAFPWKELYDAGIGAWYDDATKAKYEKQFCKTGLPSHAEITEKLKTYGYNVSDAKDAASFQQLLRAFQLHFRQQKYDGKLDTETAAILYALVEKYFSGK